MTLIVSRKWGSRIIVMSDTMISDKEACAPNIVPGRLKSLVLDKWLTVSYAGLSNQAIDSIRTLRATGPDTNTAIAFLREQSAEYGCGIDYIVCSHENPDHPRMVKIKSGEISEGADTYWIGVATSAAALSVFQVPHPTSSNISNPNSIDEFKFISTFLQYVMEARDGSVGGAVINTLCSPHGHCYQRHAGTSRWDQITIPNNEDPAVRAEIHRTGTSSHVYHIYSGLERGVCLVGYYLEQAELAFIHDPLNKYDAIPVNASDQSEFLKKLLKYEQKLLCISTLPCQLVS